MNKYIPKGRMSCLRAAGSRAYFVPSAQRLGTTKAEFTVRGESSFALIAVVILAALAATLGTAMLYGTGSQITRVSREIRYEKAFFIAEAGVELAKAELRSDGVSSFVTNTNFGGGESKYRTIMTTPSNVIIRSTGTYENVFRVLEVEVLVDPGNIPPPSTDGAAGIYGTNTSITLGGSSGIDGRDYSLPGNFDCNGIGCNGAVIATNPAAPGVFSTEDPSITGTNRITGGIITNGTSQFSTNYWQDLAEAWIPQATITLTGGTYSAATDLGTRNSPKITVVTGDTTLTSNLDGAGILIVMDGVDLNFSGNFHYEGIIILMGDNDFNVTGTARLFGALVTTSEGVNISINGNPEILYSTQALANLSNLQLNPRPLAVVYWRETK